ncbi:VWA domain-containing protein [Methanobrevibacter sp. TMH8]|uniref:VWA domain-containing protein n=1 Tax=Methanobrevibacter sp. TMH8 TaxID=2848611 RepID=UPI001CC90EF8|nr:VWA domain-containing protein [Methanobrevibacter sp. TMH8]MBZ9570231.1 VWA domain-containing protein [Methanobrevibacter sp. TMH8]
MKKNIFPFTAIVGQEKIKKALILNAINPSIGGVLIKGDRGTGKTTGVRALANLLPEIEVVEGDIFNSDLDSYYEFKLYEFYGKNKGDEVKLIKKPMKVIELPLGATEDRVVGSLDIEKALNEGKKAFEPGLLGQANGNILYIDEINLLDDNLVDILLDAAAFGVNTVEREGISISHPSRFILVGTMNPEEGELRGQLSDRIGLKISVNGITDIEERIEIIKRIDEYEKNPKVFIAKYKNQEEKLQKKIIDGRKLLPTVGITDDYIEIIARIVRNLGAEGHRSDIAILKTAKTIAAFKGNWKVQMEDLKEAILLVLGEINQCDNEQINNQIQQAQNEMNQENNFDEENQDQEDYNDDSNFDEENQDQLDDSDNSSNSEDSGEFGDNQSYDDNPDESNYDQDENNTDNEDNTNIDNENNESSEDNQINDDELDDFEDEDENENNDYGNDNQLQGEVNDSETSDDEYQVDYNENDSEKEINEFDMEDLEKDIRKMLVMEGREKEKFYGSRVDSKSEKGKYIKSKYSQKVSSSDIAVDATLRAAAMRFKKKDNNTDFKTKDNLEVSNNSNNSNGLKINIKNQDIREKVRKHKARASVAIVVDMSGSMLGEKKVNKIRAILDRIIKNINRNRDKLSVIGFKGKDSEIIIPNTKRPNSFLDKLDKITVGGTTPMASGLEKALEILKTEKRKGEFIPMLILLSDGMPNVGLKDSYIKKSTGSPVNDVLAVGEELAENDIYTVIIDFEKKHKHGRNINMELAFLANGRYYDLEDVYNPSIAIDKILTYERKIL